MALKNFSPVLRQWDAFFKEIAPGSTILREDVAKYLKVKEQDLIPGVRHQTEFRSRVVADALHHKGLYKEFRLDGLFRTAAYPAFGYEYQTTYNNGMPLRILMYEIAVREELRDLPEEGGIQFVILYSGRGLSKEKAKKIHGHRIGYFTSAIFIDLNQMDLTALTSSDIASYILALAREDASVDSFLAAKDRINEEIESYDERDRLKRALVVAAAAKIELYKTLKRLTMDDLEIQKHLSALADDAAHQAAKDILIKFIKKIQNAPLDLLGLMENWEASDLSSLANKIDLADESNDWDELRSYASAFRLG